MKFNHEEEDYNLSISRYESMLQSNTIIFFDSEEFECIIHHYLDLGKITKAKKAISYGLSQHPGSIPLKLLKVELLIFEDRLDKASQILTELHAIEMDNEDIYIHKANVFSKQNNHVDAIKLLKTALNYTEDEAEVFALIGMEYLFLDDFENAKKSFKKCLAIDELDYTSLYNIIYCFEYLEQREEAITFLTSYVDRNPYCNIAWHQLGRQYYELKSYKKALVAFDFAIISDEYFIGAYFEKGKVLEKLNRYEEAIENYNITLELDDPTSFALLRIGKCFEKLGHDKLAIKHFSSSVREDPLLDKGWIAITDFYTRKKNYRKALYYTNKAIAINSDNVLYWKRYAKINSRLGFLEEAERGYKKAIDLGNNELEIWLERFDILRSLGESDMAIQNLFQACEYHANNAEIQFRLAGIFYEKNEIHKGEFHLQKALNIDPEYVIILEELFPKTYKLPNVQFIIQVNTKEGYLGQAHLNIQ